MSTPVVWWEVAGKDGKRTQEFFSKLFDWKVEVDEKMNYGMVNDTGEGGIGGGLYQAPQGEPYVVFYVKVDDIPAYLKKAEKLGGKTVVEPQDIPGIGQSAFFKDPDGNIIGLFKPAQG